MTSSKFLLKFILLRFAPGEDFSQGFLCLCEYFRARPSLAPRICRTCVKGVHESKHYGASAGELTIWGRCSEGGDYAQAPALRSATKDPLYALLRASVNVCRLRHMVPHARPHTNTRTHSLPSTSSSKTNSLHAQSCLPSTNLSFGTRARYRMVSRAPSHKRSLPSVVSFGSRNASLICVGDKRSLSTRGHACSHVLSCIQ
jgi:hypothetical protein